MSSIANTYRSAAMLSEEPSGQWVIKGIRGVKTYIYMSIRAINDQNIEAKNQYVDKASKLLVLLQGITKPEGENSLGGKLSTIYTNFQLALTKAHAGNNIIEFRNLAAELEALELNMANVIQK
jgi:flagellin-specific chaperone FliS